ncbi:MAG: hypothetical protein LBQ79_13505, partial [Deltaproteobacteria bacterium]|nr:hypothetical protein [Deltaproteobacteria bacterium]
MPLQYLASSDLSRCHAESPGGVKALGAYGVLERLAESEISRDAADFLAEPSERPGWVDWHTRLEGRPVPFGALDGHERDSALDALCSMAARYRELSERLAGSGSDARATAGAITERVARAAAACAVGASGPMLFMVDGKPVLAGWGVSTAMGGLAAEGFELTEYQLELCGLILAGARPPMPDSRPAPPPPPEPFHPPGQAPAPPHAPAPDVGTAPPPLVPVRPEPRKRLLRHSL